MAPRPRSTPATWRRPGVSWTKPSRRSRSWRTSSTAEMWGSQSWLMPHTFPVGDVLHLLWGGQFCPQPAFSRHLLGSVLSHAPREPPERRLQARLPQCHILFPVTTPVLMVGRTPGSAADAPVGLLARCKMPISLYRLRDEGVPRGPGGPPHHFSRIGTSSCQPPFRPQN